jgi:hypothetical protein
MSIFGLAVCPHGNVLKLVAQLRREAFRAGDSCRDFGLPEALWTGFALAPESCGSAGLKDCDEQARALAGRLRTWAVRICGELPQDLRFDSLAWTDGRLYCATSEPLPASLCTITEDFFLESGFVPLDAKSASLPEPGRGFHVGNSVTIEAAKAFSFRQFFLVLYRFDPGSLSNDCLVWDLLARVPRPNAEAHGAVRR